MGEKLGLPETRVPRRRAPCRCVAAGLHPCSSPLNEMTNLLLHFKRTRVRLFPYFLLFP